VAELTVASLMRNPNFRAELEQASKELAALEQRAQVPPARRCLSEQAMMNRPY
jgi:hypothetical protein